MSTNDIPDQVKHYVLSQMMKICSEASNESTISVKSISEQVKQLVETDDPNLSDDFKSGAFSMAMTCIMFAAVESGDEETMIKIAAVLPQ